MMTFVWTSTATEAWATVTATDSASPITGEQGPSRMDIYFVLFLFEMWKKQLSTSFQIDIPRRRIQGDRFSLDLVYRKTLSFAGRQYV